MNPYRCCYVEEKTPPQATDLSAAKAAQNQRSYAGQVKPSVCNFPAVKLASSAGLGVGTTQGCAGFADVNRTDKD